MQIPYHLHPALSYSLCFWSISFHTTKRRLYPASFDLVLAIKCQQTLSFGIMFMICQGAYDGKLNFVHCACVMSYISQYINLIRCFMCYAWLTSCILIPCGCCHGRAVQKQWTFDSMSFNFGISSPRDFDSL